MNSATTIKLPNAMLPLWLKYPEIPRYAIGWRMGAGEDYSCKFSEWWEALSSEVKQEYQNFYPEPVGWRGWYVEEDWDEAGKEEAANTYDLDGF
jgi:hypothetical protein